MFKNTMRLSIAALAIVGALAFAQGGPGQGGPGQGGPGRGGPGQGGPGRGGFGQGGPGMGGPGGPGMGGPGMGGPGMGGRMMGQMGGMMGGPQGPAILMIPQVREELKLTTAQMNKLQEILPRQMGGPGGPGMGGPGMGGPGGPGMGGPGGPGRGGFGQGGPGQGGPGQGGPGQGGPGRGGFGQGGPGQGGPGRGGFGQGGPGMGGPGMGGPGMGMNAEGMARLEESIKEILKPAQYKRYREIAVQLAGPQGFFRPDIREELGINEAQLGKIQEVLQANRPRFQEGGQGQPPQPPSEADRKKVLDAVLKVLTDGQRSKYKAMTGTPFQLRPRGE